MIILFLRISGKNFLSLGQPDEFARLYREMLHSRRMAYSSGTSSNLRTQFRAYLSFCVYFRRVALPADLKTIATYAQFLSRSVTPQTVRNYLSGVKFLHILLGLDYPFTESFILRLVLRGISRLNPHVPRRARPVTPNILRAIAAQVDPSSSLHLAVYACALLSFFLMARVGSVLPVSSAVSSRLYLSASAVRLAKHGLLVSFRHTKTIQFVVNVYCT